MKTKALFLTIAGKEGDQQADNNEAIRKSRALGVHPERTDITVFTPSTSVCERPIPVPTKCVRVKSC